jgi:hypothetical protein
MSPKEKSSATNTGNRPTFEESCTPRDHFDREFAILWEVVSGIALSEYLPEANEENGIDMGVALQEQYGRAYRVARYFADLADKAEDKMLHAEGGPKDVAYWAHMALTIDKLKSALHKENEQLKEQLCRLAMENGELTERLRQATEVSAVPAGQGQGAAT